MQHRGKAALRRSDGVDGVLWQGSTKALSYSYLLSGTEIQHIKQAFTWILCAQSCRL